MFGVRLGQLIRNNYTPLLARLGLASTNATTCGLALLLQPFACFRPLNNAGVCSVNVEVCIPWVQVRIATRRSGGSFSRGREVKERESWKPLAPATSPVPAW